MPGGDPGFGISVTMVLVTSFTFAVSVSTPPLLGPLCVVDCFAYPYADMAGRYPREYRFELAVISVDWLVLLIAGTLSALHFRRTAAKRGENDEKA